MLSCTTSPAQEGSGQDRKSTRLNSSHSQISYAVFCLKKKSRTKYTIGFGQHPILVGSKLDDTVGNDHLHRGVGSGICSISPFSNSTCCNPDLVRFSPA